MISIIVPVHNNEGTLRRCLDSIAKQTFSNYEVCLIVNGCSDASESVCKEYEMRDKRFKVFYSDKGASRARNQGLRQAKGNYVAFVDADDFVYACYLERMYNAINSTSAGMAVCSYDILDLQLKINKNIAIREDCQSKKYTEQVECLYVDDLLNPLWNKLYRKELIENYMNPEYIIGEDLDFNLNYLSTLPEIVYVNEPCYAYISYKSEISKNYNQNRFQKLKALHKKVEGAFLKVEPAFVLEQHTQLVSKMQREVAICINENIIVYGIKSLAFIKTILDDDSTKRLFRMHSFGRKNRIVRRIVLTNNSVLVYIFFRIGNKVK